MSYTCSDITSQVTARLKDASIGNSTILQFINDTNREICNRYEWDFMQTTVSFNTTASDSSYPLSGVATDIQKLVNLRITTDGSERWLKPINTEQFDRHIADPSSATAGVPDYYYLWNDVIYLYPTPDAVYTIEARYLKTPTTLESGDQPDVPEPFQEVVMLGTLYRAMQTNDNFDQALVVKNQMDTQVIDMIRRLMPFPSGSPRVMPTSNRRPSTRGIF